MNVVSHSSVSLESRWRPAAYRPPAAVLRPQGPAMGVRRLGQVTTANPLDSRVISFITNGGASVVSFMAARVFQPGFWRTGAIVIGVLAGLRGMNDFFVMTGVGMAKATQ